jgi:hypothetical protein
VEVVGLVLIRVFSLYLRLFKLVLEKPLFELCLPVVHAHKALTVLLLCQKLQIVNVHLSHCLNFGKEGRVEHYVWRQGVTKTTSRERRGKRMHCHTLGKNNDPPLKQGRSMHAKNQCKIGLGLGLGLSCLVLGRFVIRDFSWLLAQQKAKRHREQTYSRRDNSTLDLMLPLTLPRSLTHASTLALTTTLPLTHPNVTYRLVLAAARGPWNGILCLFFHENCGCERSYSMGFRRNNIRRTDMC